MSAAYRLTGRLTVPLPPDQAFHLFTARGEQDWVPGWAPHFPASVTDDGAPGTVFETHADGESTIWVVVDRIPGRHICYARVAPHSAAGTVTVTLDDVGGHSEVTVTYALTALTDAANDHLHAFSEGYPDLLSTWQDAIAAALRA